MLYLSGCTQVGACVLAATTLNPSKLMWTALIVSLEARHCKNASGNSSKKQRAHSINRASKLCRSQSNHHLRDVPEQAHSKEATPWNPQDRKDLLPKSRCQIPQDTPLNSHVHSQTGQSSFSFFLFFFCGMRGRDIIVIRFLFIA